MRVFIRNFALAALSIAIVLVVVGQWIHMLPITLLGFAVGTVLGLPAGYIWFVVTKFKKPSLGLAEMLSRVRSEIKKRVPDVAPKQEQPFASEDEPIEVRIISSNPTDDPPPAPNTMPEMPAPIAEVEPTPPPAAKPANGNGNGRKPDEAIQIPVRIEPTPYQLKLEAERRAEEERRLAEEERRRQEEEQRESERRQREEERRLEEERRALIDKLNATTADDTAWVIEQLGHVHPLVRVSAVQALRRIDGPDSIAPLNAALNDADEVVRRAAKIALRELGHQV